MTTLNIETTTANVTAAIQYLSLQKSIHTATVADYAADLAVEDQNEMLARDLTVFGLRAALAAVVDQSQTIADLLDGYAENDANHVHPQYQQMARHIINGAISGGECERFFTREHCARMRKADVAFMADAVHTRRLQSRKRQNEAAANGRHAFARLVAMNATAFDVAFTNLHEQRA